MYNYEFVNSSSNKSETKLLNKIISFHIHRIFLIFKNRQFKDLTL